MTTPDHWRHAHAALDGGPLADVETLLEHAAQILLIAGQGPGMEHLARTAGWLRDAARGIASCRTLVNLGCPKPNGARIVLDPMERA